MNLRAGRRDGYRMAFVYQLDHFVHDFYVAAATFSAQADAQQRCGSLASSQGHQVDKAWQVALTSCLISLAF
jgi:hypothetical protein